ncbi:MAG TPA: PA14 domain-containing protein [Anaerolineae bacterium]|nr:PA14 domain-containing protein [Anaerolineae bacterium]
MLNPGFGRWALAIIVIALILALVAAATVVMASAILQPEINPTIEVQPQVVKPGDIVVVSGRGWPGLANTVVVIALSPTRDLASAGLLPVGAVAIDVSGRLAASFVYPSDVPWSALREAWVVVRPPTGTVQASAHLSVQRLLATPTPTPNLASTPILARQQIQGTIVQLAPDLGLAVVNPFTGGAHRGVNVRHARVQFADGRSGTLADLKVGVTIAAWGWFDSGGILTAEEIMILETKTTLLVPVTVAAPTPAAATCLLPTPAVIPFVMPATVCVVAAPPAAPACTPAPAICPTALAGAIPLDRWQGDYFPNPWLSGPPVLVREYRVVDFNWRQGAPAPELPAMGYSARWSGVFWYPSTCCYRFMLLLKGNARLWVDGRLLIDQWNSPPPSEYQAEVSLAQGPHQLKLEYRNMGTQGRIQLRWEAVGTLLGEGL